MRRLAPLLLLLLASCRVEDGGPSIRIVSPGNGDVVQQNGAVIEVDVDELTLTSEMFTPPLAGGTETGEPFHGHYHLYVSEAGASVYDAHVIGCFWDTTIVVPEPLPLGPKQLTVILGNQNHMAITGSDPAKVQVTIVP